MSASWPLVAKRILCRPIGRRTSVGEPTHKKNDWLAVAVSGTSSGTHISLACLRQIALKYGGGRTYAYAQLRSITCIYHGFTVFAANLKFAGRKAVGVQIPLRAPYETVDKSLKMKCLRVAPFCRKATSRFSSQSSGTEIGTVRILFVYHKLRGAGFSGHRLITLDLPQLP